MHTKQTKKYLIQTLLLALNMNIPVLAIDSFDENGQPDAVYVNQFKQHLERHHKDIMHPHAHHFYICVLFTAGSGTHTIDFNTYPIHPGAMFFMQPKHVHEWTFDSAAEGWIFFHSAAFYQAHQLKNQIQDWSFYQTPTANPYLHLDPTTFESISKNFEAMYTEYCSNEAYRFSKIAALQQLIYIDSARAYQQKDSSAHEFSKRFKQLYHAFEILIEKHYMEAKSPAFYATKMAISTKHLHRICMAISGNNPTKMIAERTVLEAKRKLVVSNLQIQQIATELGFESYPYFNRFFKKYCGISPVVFKKINR